MCKPVCGLYTGNVGSLDCLSSICIGIRIFQKILISVIFYSILELNAK